jgi:16S rRNA (cytidine1402-2'-O)-methyltransferase
MSGTLYVVATPLGNLSDLSPRAAQVLKTCACVCAEDTRRSRILLQHFSIQTPLVSLHAHNEHLRITELICRLQDGDDLALVSDAGTPSIHDPGVLLIDAAHSAGVRVSPIPGPCALSTALSAAGFAMEQGAFFRGFLPPRGAIKTEALQQVMQQTAVVVLFESPMRLLDTLTQAAKMSPRRMACVCRELSKIYEEIVRAPLQELVDWAAAQANIRGELTLVIGPQSHPATSAGDAEIDAALQRCLQANLSRRDAATAVAAVLQCSRRQVYARTLLLAAPPQQHA